MKTEDNKLRNSFRLLTQSFRSFQIWIHQLHKVVEGVERCMEQRIIAPLREGKKSKILQLVNYDEMKTLSYTTGV